MKMYKHHLVFSLLMMLVIQAATAQQEIPAGSSSLVNSPRPLADAAQRLQETYEEVVTYEEPILTWRGDLEADPRQDPKGKWAFRLKKHAFVMPAENRTGTDLASALENTIAAYHQQTSDIRFKALSSKLGHHIVPIQMHDENGRFAAGTSVLDRIVTVPNEARTASQHLLALVAAIGSASSTFIDISGAFPRGFDNGFRAQAAIFPWGAYSVVARDALIDLLSQSATSFSWHLNCQPSPQPKDRFCVLNMHVIEVAVTDSDGKPVTDSQGKRVKRVLKYDRCRDCPPAEDRLNR